MAYEDIKKAWQERKIEKKKIMKLLWIISKLFLPIIQELLKTRK